MSTWIDGTVGGGKLYCRKSPSTSAAAWGRFENGTKIKVRDVEGHPDWYETYWNNDVSKVGYVIRNYVDAIVMPEDVKLTFSRENAVIYAEKHSETTDPGKLCSNRNKTFGSATTNDCANFVSQCLCAGGMPMFKGWSYPVSGIPSGWKKASKWSLTESGMNQLLRVGFPKLSIPKLNAVILFIPTSLLMLMAKSTPMLHLPSLTTKMVIVKSVVTLTTRTM